MSDSAGTCPNCGSERAGPYCHACGQDNRFESPRGRDWIGDLVDMFTNVNRSLLRTIGQLVYRPGGMARDYVGGQRVRYSNPVRFAVVTSAIWWMFVAIQIAGVDLEAAGLDAGRRLMLRFGQPLNLLLMPGCALAVWVAFLGSRTNYAKTLCSQLYFAGFAFLWRAVIGAIGPYAPAWLHVWLNPLDQVLFLVYMPFAMWGFYRGHARWLVLRIPLALVLLVYFSDYANRGIVRFANYLDANGVVEPKPVEEAEPTARVTPVPGLDRNRLLIELAEKGRFWRVPFEQLSGAEKALRSVWDFESDVYRLGFRAYFDGSGGDHADSLVTALEWVGASRTAGIVQGAMALFPGSVPPRNLAVRRRLVAAFTTEQDTLLQALDLRLRAEPEDLTRLLFEFVRAHATDIQGADAFSPR